MFHHISQILNAGIFPQLPNERQVYETLEQLQYELADYVNWFHNHRIHSSFGYLTPKEYRLTALEKVLTIHQP